MGNRRFWLWPLFLGFLGGTAGVKADAPPFPTFDGLQVASSCAYDPGRQRYRYDYQVTNPPANTVGVWLIKLPLGKECPEVEELTKPPGWAAHLVAFVGLRRR